MTVDELIEELQKYDGRMEVITAPYTDSEDWEFHVIPWLGSQQQLEITLGEVE